MMTPWRSCDYGLIDGNSWHCELLGLIAGARGSWLPCYPGLSLHTASEMEETAESFRICFPQVFHRPRLLFFHYFLKKTCRLILIRIWTQVTTGGSYSAHDCHSRCLYYSGLLGVPLDWGMPLGSKKTSGMRRPG